MPAAPVGDLCVVDIAGGGDDCASIATVSSNYQSAGASISAIVDRATSFVPYASTDNYVCFSPISWANVQVYINELQQIAQNSCQAP